MLPNFKSQAEGEAYLRDPANYQAFVNDDSKMGPKMLGVLKSLGWNWDEPIAPTVVQDAVAVAVEEPTAETVVGEESEFLAATDTVGYLQRMFQPGDWIDIQLIHQTEKFVDKFGSTRSSTRDNFQLLENAVGPTTPQQLAAFQNEGWNVYVTMNVFTQDLRRRREMDVTRVNSVYIEFDENGDAGIAKVRADADANLIPYPHFVLRSSPGKYYVIWLVEGFDVPTQKALNKILQVRYGSDPASVDAARVLRLPGTRNLKYAEQPVVEIIDEAPGDRCTADEFKVKIEVPKQVDRLAAPEKVQSRMDYYESACENAGVKPGDLTGPVVGGPYAGSYSYVVECPNWEEHTNGSKMDGSVWISPSGRISYGCWHTHCKEKGLDWARFYRPWMEEQAIDNGYKKKLKFGDVKEVDDDSDSAAALSLSTPAAPTTEPQDAQEQAPETNEVPADADDDADSAVPNENLALTTGYKRLTSADIFAQLQATLEGRGMPWHHGMAADFFSMLFGENYRYAIMGKAGDWMQWNGHMWHPGNVSTMQKRIDNLLGRIRTQVIPELGAAIGAALARDDKPLAEGMTNTMNVLKALDKKCGSSDFMSGVMQMLRNKLLVNFSDFDSSDKLLVNFINGTLELDTNTFRESRREDMLTQTMPVAYKPKTLCSVWRTFLENSFPDADVREFLHRFFGYMLEGTGKEKVAAFFHGYGDNGKTMLMAVLNSIFGFQSDNAYGKSVGWQTFAENQSGAIRNDIARLHNARAVFCDESEQGMILKESVFKALTGASPITARFLHKEFFTFFAKFVFVLTTNRLPSVKGGDGASWSRILKVPMTQSFPVGHPKRIEGLKALLMAEREGIAAWMVEGYRKYVTDGLKVPQAIKDASLEYRENSDVIESFLTECTEPSSGRVLFEQVYERYSQWCFRNHEKEQGKDSFIDNLKARGYDTRRQMNWQGRPRIVYGLKMLKEGVAPSNPEQAAVMNEGGSNHVAF